jgi:lipoprotein-anchoring transpeptidase ErfK/SrfK
MLRRTIAGGLLVSVWLSAWAAAPHAVARAAEIVISVNKATQTMVVLIDGAEAYNWTISTGVGGGPYDGTYKPGRMERKWASRKYGMAPMPYSIFFDGEGRAFHSGDTAGTSHGCIHLEVEDARAVFAALDIGDEVQIRS